MTNALSRRSLVAVLSLLPTVGLAQARPSRATAALSAEDRVVVDRAVSHLQAINSVKGRFTQTDARGRVTKGDFFLKRPGKVRFAYDAPSDLLVVSDGSQVMVHDKRLKTFNAYALNMTPLSLFLAREIRLDRGVIVSDVRRFSDGFSITARDQGKDVSGQITLVFGERPTSLREWTVVDGQGQRTRVALSGLRAANIDPALFVLRDPRPKGGGKR